MKKLRLRSTAFYRTYFVENVEASTSIYIYHILYSCRSPAFKLILQAWAQAGLSLLYISWSLSYSRCHHRWKRGFMEGGMNQMACPCQVSLILSVFFQWLLWSIAEFRDSVAKLDTLCSNILDAFVVSSPGNIILWRMRDFWRKPWLYLHGSYKWRRIHTNYESTDRFGP